jgi:hypothetical protein
MVAKKITPTMHEITHEAEVETGRLGGMRLRIDNLRSYESLTLVELQTDQQHHEWLGWKAISRE